MDNNEVILRATIALNNEDASRMDKGIAILAIVLLAEAEYNKPYKSVANSNISKFAR